MATKCNPLNHFNFSVNKFSTPRAHRSTHQLPFFFLATKSKQALISSRAADRCCQMLVGYSTIIRIRHTPIVTVFFCYDLHLFFFRFLLYFVQSFIYFCNDRSFYSGAVAAAVPLVLSARSLLTQVRGIKCQPYYFQISLGKEVKRTEAKNTFFGISHPRVQ